MKKGIHPTYNEKAVVTCACGNKFTVGATVDSISVEICSTCHPFWTGDVKFVDTEGRVDKFIKKQKVAETEREKRIKAIKEKIRREKLREEAPKSLKEMLKSMQ